MKDRSFIRYVLLVNSHNKLNLLLWPLIDKCLAPKIKKINKKKKMYFVGMKFCCACNAAIKNVKIPRKVSTFSKKNFNDIVFFSKITDF